MSNISKIICQLSQDSFSLNIAEFSFVVFYSSSLGLDVQKSQTIKVYDQSPLILNFFVAFMFIQLVTVIISIYSIYLSGNIDKITAGHKRFSRIIGKVTCGFWTMPPNMEPKYDPQFDQDDENDLYDEEEEVKFYLDMQDKFLFLLTIGALVGSYAVTILRSIIEQ